MRLIVLNPVGQHFALTCLLSPWSHCGSVTCGQLTVQVHGVIASPADYLRVLVASKVQAVRARQLYPIHVAYLKFTLSTNGLDNPDITS